MPSVDAPRSEAAPPRRWGVRALAAAAVVVGLGTVAVVLRHDVRPEREEPAAIAVLPFESVSWNPAGAYLTDGLHDTLIGHLARIHDVRVISRTSVMAYRGSSAGLAQIARELGVAHVVQGVVQLAGRQVKVKAIVTEAATGTHVWSETYERDLADVFEIQADLTRQIAKAIGARLTPKELAQLERAPTRDLEAYELYLRALEVDRQPTPQKPALAAAVAQLERAITRDPQFAEAHALLSRLQMTIYWVAGDYDKALLPAAQQHADAALRLAPDLAQAQMAMALYWYWGHRDYPKALESLEAAYAREPNNAFAHYLSGTIRMRFGQWPQALASLRIARELDPRNERILQTSSVALSEARRFAEAEEVLGRLLAVAPRSAFAIALRVRNRLRWQGDAAAVELRLAEPGAPDAPDDPYCLLPLAGFELALARGQYGDAAEAMAACDKPVVGMLHSVPAPKTQFTAIARFFAGDLRRARADSQAARQYLEARLEQRPDLPLARMAVAYMLAIEGRRAEALAQAERALADMPASVDAVVAAELLDNAAALHAQLGEHERALDELGRALQLPNGAFAPVVRRNPFWKALWSDPRFLQRLDAPPQR